MPKERLGLSLCLPVCKAHALPLYCSVSGLQEALGASRNRLFFQDKKKTLAHKVSKLEPEEQEPWPGHQKLECPRAGDVG